MITSKMCDKKKENAKLPLIHFTRPQEEFLLTKEIDDLLNISADADSPSTSTTMEADVNQDFSWILDSITEPLSDNEDSLENCNITVFQAKIEEVSEMTSEAEPSDNSCTIKNSVLNSSFTKRSLNCISNSHVKPISKKVLMCLNCEFTTNWPSRLRRHSSKHIKAKLFKCWRCGYTTKRERFLILHESKCTHPVCTQPTKKISSGNQVLSGLDSAEEGSFLGISSWRSVQILDETVVINKLEELDPKGGKDERSSLSILNETVQRSNEIVEALKNELKEMANPEGGKEEEESSLNISSEEVVRTLDKNVEAARSELKDTTNTEEFEKKEERDSPNMFSEEIQILHKTIETLKNELKETVNLEGGKVGERISPSISGEEAVQTSDKTVEAARKGWKLVPSPEGEKQEVVNFLQTSNKEALQTLNETANVIGSKMTEIKALKKTNKGIIDESCFKTIENINKIFSSNIVSIPNEVRPMEYIECAGGNETNVKLLDKKSYSNSLPQNKDNNLSRDLSKCSLCNFKSRLHHNVIRHALEKHGDTKPLNRKTPFLVNGKPRIKIKSHSITSYNQNKESKVSLQSSQLHTVSGTWKCSFCDFESKWCHNVIRHSRTKHSDVNLLHCKAPIFTNRQTDKTNLEFVSNHSQQLRDSDVTRQQETKNDNVCLLKTSKCALCSYETKWHHNLIRHIMKKHGGMNALNRQTFNLVTTTKNKIKSSDMQASYPSHISQPKSPSFYDKNAKNFRINSNIHEKVIKSTCHNPVDGEEEFGYYIENKTNGGAFEADNTAAEGNAEHRRNTLQSRTTETEISEHLDVRKKSLAPLQDSATGNEVIEENRIQCHPTPNYGEKCKRGYVCVNKIFICSFCGFQTKWRHSVIRHVQKKHRDTNFKRYDHAFSEVKVDSALHYTQYDGGESLRNANYNSKLSQLHSGIHEKIDSDKPSNLSFSAINRWGKVTLPNNIARGLKKFKSSNVLGTLSEQTEAKEKDFDELPNQSEGRDVDVPSNLSKENAQEKTNKFISSPKMSKCSYCDYESRWLGNIKRHMLQEHKDLDELEEQVKCRLLYDASAMYPNENWKGKDGERLSNLNLTDTNRILDEVNHLRDSALEENKSRGAGTHTTKLKLADSKSCQRQRPFQEKKPEMNAASLLSQNNLVSENNDLLDEDGDDAENECSIGVLCSTEDGETGSRPSFDKRFGKTFKKAVPNHSNVSHSGDFTFKEAASENPHDINDRRRKKKTKVTQNCVTEVTNNTLSEDEYSEEEESLNKDLPDVDQELKAISRKCNNIVENILAALTSGTNRIKKDIVANGSLSECCEKDKIKQSTKTVSISSKNEAVFKCSHCNYEAKRQSRLEMHTLKHSQIGHSRRSNRISFRNKKNLDVYHFPYAKCKDCDLPDVRKVANKITERKQYLDSAHVPNDSSAHATASDEGDTASKGHDLDSNSVDTANCLVLNKYKNPTSRRKVLEWSKRRLNNKHKIKKFHKFSQHDVTAKKRSALQKHQHPSCTEIGHSSLQHETHIETDTEKENVEDTCSKIDSLTKVTSFTEEREIRSSDSPIKAEETYNCPECPYKTKWRIAFHRHVSTKHKKTEHVVTEACQNLVQQSPKYGENAETHIHAQKADASQIDAQMEKKDCGSCEVGSILRSEPCIAETEIRSSDSPVKAEETYNCPECPYKTKWRIAFQRHVTTKHKKIEHVVTEEHAKRKRQLEACQNPLQQSPKYDENTETDILVHAQKADASQIDAPVEKNYCGSCEVGSILRSEPCIEETESLDSKNTEIDTHDQEVDTSQIDAQSEKNDYGSCKVESILPSELCIEETEIGFVEFSKVLKPDKSQKDEEASVDESLNRIYIPEKLSLCSHSVTNSRPTDVTNHTLGVKGALEGTTTSDANSVRKRTRKVDSENEKPLEGFSCLKFSKNGNIESENENETTIASDEIVESGSDTKCMPVINMAETSLRPLEALVARTDKNGREVLVCSKCNFKTKRGKYFIDRHLLSHIKVPLKCSHCDHKTKTARSMALHMKKHKIRSFAQRRYTCGICKYKFIDHRYLKLHELRFASTGCCEGKKIVKENSLSQSEDPEPQSLKFSLNDVDTKQLTHQQHCRTEPKKSVKFTRDTIMTRRQKKGLLTNVDSGSYCKCKDKKPIGPTGSKLRKIKGTPSTTGNDQCTDTIDSQGNNETDTTVFVKTGNSKLDATNKRVECKATQTPDQMGERFIDNQLLYQSFSQNFITQSLITAAAVSNTNKWKFECSYCAYKSKQRANLKRHLIIVHRHKHSSLKVVPKVMKEATIKCSKPLNKIKPNQPKESTNQKDSYYKNQTDIKSNGKKTPSLQEELYLCLKSFGNAGGIVTLLPAETGNCEGNAQPLNKLNQNAINQTSVNELSKPEKQPFQCSHCHYRTYNKSHFKRHLKGVHKYEEFSCTPKPKSEITRVLTSEKRLPKPGTKTAAKFAGPAKGISVTAVKQAEKSFGQTKSNVDRQTKPLYCCLKCNLKTFWRSAMCRHILRFNHGTFTKQRHPARSKSHNQKDGLRIAKGSASKKSIGAPIPVKCKLISTQNGRSGETSSRPVTDEKM